MTSQLQLKIESSFTDVQFIDIRSQLPVNPNYTWSQLAGIRDINALNTIVCHHDALPKYKTIKYGDVELASRIATDHIRSKKITPKEMQGFPMIYGFETESYTGATMSNLESTELLAITDIRSIFASQVIIKIMIS